MTHAHTQTHRQTDNDTKISADT